LVSTNVSEFLLNLEAEQRGLAKRMLSDYKEGKAYSYFASNWLKEVLYHPISDDSPLCFLMARSTPSQNLNNVPHKIWVLVHKKSGKVEGAYCTCFAGYSGTKGYVLCTKMNHKILYTNIEKLKNPADIFDHIKNKYVIMVACGIS
jgi:hypothetical protein